MLPQSTFAIAAAVGLLAASSGVAAAQPTQGPPGDLPGVVPDFVSGLLDAVGEFVVGLLQGVSETVSGLTPDAAGDGPGTPGVAR